MQSIGVGVNFMRDRGISLDFTKTFTVNRNENTRNTRNTRRVIICVKLDETNFSEGEQIRFQVCIEEFKQVFSDKPSSQMSLGMKLLRVISRLWLLNRTGMIRLSKV